jgi:outer membrane protein assembly factor BamB
VYVWDIKHQTVVWASTGMNGGSRVAVADLDGDGVKEIIALASDRVVVFARSGANTYLERASYSVAGLDLLVADTDGDGKPEIYVLVPGPAILRLDNNLQLLGSYTVPPTQGIYLESSAFPRKNIVLAKTESQYPYPAASAQLSIVDPASGDVIWESTPIPGTVGVNALSFHDVNSDGQLEMIFGTPYGMFVTR